MIYCFDLDNTISITNGNNYETSLPNLNFIRKVNYLYDSGHTIKIFTARGMTTYAGDISLVYFNLFSKTKDQLDNWGLKYHHLILGKPSFDFFIDDKNITINEFNKSVKPNKGFIAGAFDLLHPGYIKMFKNAKENCEHLIVGLHVDPSLERNKVKPILSKEERFEILSSIKFIDEIIFYETEEDLLNLISNLSIDILFLGDDYAGQNHNGKKLNIQTHFISRDHGWSTTKLKNLIKNA
jgi:glycerol-3-phosphate cytidylyltransferase